MPLFIVTRHDGAIDWLLRQPIVAGATVLRHVDDQPFGPGDKIFGVLTLALAARICTAGAQAHVLSYDVPFALRGQELSAAKLDELGARLVRYEVREIPATTGAPDAQTSA